MIDWQFEHFKTFTPYEIMQQAAAALSLYEGESTDGVNPKMGRLTDVLAESTKHPAWMPARENGNLDINTEGSVFRNKARLFSTFYICVPPDLLKESGEEKAIMLTPFGKALAQGKVSRREFYRYIVQKFQYPHPAYSDYDRWVESGVVIRPLLCIIKTLVFLFEHGGKDDTFLSAKDVYFNLQSLTNEDCEPVAQQILDLRRKGQAYEDASTDQLRKISEMFAFLAIGDYVYIDSTSKGDDRYFLNLIARHPKEKTLFYLSRTAGGAGTGTSKTKYNIIDEYKKLWEE